MSVPAGFYFITGNGKAKGFRVGRGFVEDLSLRPKPILAIPPGGPVVSPAIIRKADNGFTDIVFNGDASGNYVSKVYAFILRDMGDIGWVLEATKVPNAWKIKTKDGNLYWQVSSTKGPFGYPIDLQPRNDTEEQIFTVTLAPNPGGKSEEKPGKEKSGKEKSGKE